MSELMRRRIGLVLWIWLRLMSRGLVAAILYGGLYGGLSLLLPYKDSSHPLVPYILLAILILVWLRLMLRGLPNAIFFGGFYVGLFLFFYYSDSFQFLLPVFLLATLIGGGYGLAIGLPVVILDGLLVSILAIAFFLPPDRRRYLRLSIGATSACFTALAVVLIFSRFGNLFILESLRNENYLLGILPILMAGLGMWQATQNVLSWYKREGSRQLPTA